MLDDKVNKTVILSDHVHVEYSVPCLICGRSIILSGLEKILAKNGHSVIKVCDDCKDTIVTLGALKDTIVEHVTKEN